MSTIKEIVGLQGQLVMVNLRSSQCGLEIADGTYRENIYFDETLIEQIKSALQQEVYLIGWHIQDQGKKKSDRFEIHELYRLDTNTTPQQLRDLLSEYLADNNTRANLRAGLREALTGETHPIAELWDGIDVE
jgi:hypothetical protein